MQVLCIKKGAQRAPIFKERETRLELATTCLEGRDYNESAYQASLAHIHIWKHPATATATLAGGMYANK